MPGRPIMTEDTKILLGEAALAKFSEEEIEEYRRIMETRKEERRKNCISIRLDQATLVKVRSLGQGYTGVLARLIALAIDDEEMLKKCL